MWTLAVVHVNPNAIRDWNLEESITHRLGNLEVQIAAWRESPPGAAGDCVHVVVVNAEAVLAMGFTST